MYIAHGERQVFNSLPEVICWTLTEASETFSNPCHLRQHRLRNRGVWRFQQPKFLSWQEPHRRFPKRRENEVVNIEFFAKIKIKTDLSPVANLAV
jgi:hypothetical protein